MLNPDEDTEWNDILRSKGILPPKPKETEITEEEIVSIVEKTIKQKTQNDGKKELDQMNLDELDELEDSEDEYVLEEYRRKRIAEMKAIAEKSKFGVVCSISAQDYVDEVNKAGEGIWVVLHLYANGVPLCNIINHYMASLAQKYPQTKFLKSVATTCIADFPEKNCPSIFIYYEGNLKKQYIGSVELRGDKLTKDELEWMLGQSGAINTDLKEDPRPKIRDKMQNDLQFCDF
ncbi:viral IAP-associated factor homolog [Condylostylus longicornis]|uniref:viral IAP-associated factor homolog n=1 Tax=Condylostylus longicornis TaxID=2530218 RepID=UPI00244E07EF|nr:viral IAP-associated factor homolog [Condylostylus longicornis]XP_055383499.1 viral IAP-associated factor homolog [Condylostylus longicornis]XP_055383500.1 viral IAP-associated factor homolog [Condylostylus longicornis]